MSPAAWGVFSSSLVTRPSLTRSLTVTLPLLTLGTSGCGARPSDRASHVMELPRPTPAPAGTTRWVSKTDPCHQRAGCEIEARHEAGTSAAGHRMLVVEVSLGMRDDEGDEPSGARNCEEREVWLVHVDSPLAGGAPPPLPLLTMCNDGYGASGVGEDELQIAPNELVHTRMGGSAWRWSTTTTAQLDPPRVVAESRRSWWALSQNHDSWSHFDFRSFQGSDRHEIPACDADGELPDLGDTEIDAFSSQPIPATALPSLLVGGAVDAAAEIDVSPCAAAGIAWEDPKDATYALVLDATSGTLLAQIGDDAFDPADRLLVWATSEPQRGGMHCWQSHRITPLEVSLDGKVVAGSGAYPGVTVEVGRGADTSRRLVRVRLGKVPQAISVAYRDADPGEGVGGMATSDVEARRGERVHLGAVRHVQPERATCGLVDHALGPRLTATHPGPNAGDPPGADGALMGDGW